MSFWLSIAFALEIQVSTTSDLSADDGLCSLREALAAARDEAASGATAGECVAGASGLDTLQVPAGTYVLGGTELAVDSEVALVGEGEDSTLLDGDGASRVLLVTADASLSDLTVRNGGLTSPERGAGLNVESASLTLTHVAVTDHHLTSNGTDYPRGAGIAVDAGALDMLYVRFEDNEIEGSTTRWTEGGGLFADNSVVTGSFIEMRNHTCGEAPGRGSRGCGLYVEDGTLTLTDFIFTGMATGTQQVQDGGAVFTDVTLVELQRGAAYGNTDADNGVLAFIGGDVLLRNVTVTGNTGEIEGSIHIGEATAVLDHVTVTGDPGYGLVLDDGQVTLHETVIVGNGDVGCLADLSGDVTVSSAVLDTGFDSEDCEVTGSPTYTDAVSFATLDLTSAYLPTLSPTAGGVLDGASGCLDADGATLAEDARGLARPTTSCTIGAHQLEACGDGAVDAHEHCDDFNATDGDGCSTTCAVEFDWACSGDPSVCVYEGPGVTITVTTSEDVAADDGLCSLREALTAAQQAVESGASAGECVAGTQGADTIDLPSGTYVLAGAELAVDSEISVVGAGEGSTFIDGDAASRVLQVTADASFSDLTVRNGALTASDRGAGMNVESAAVVLTNVAFTDHHLTPSGNNTPRGAAMAVDGGTLDMLYVRFEDNVIEGTTTRWTEGGGLYAEDSAVNAAFLEMRDHTCGEAPARGSRGCGLFTDGGTLTLTDFLFTGMATGTQQIQRGGAVNSDETDALLRRGVVYGNTDSGDGVLAFDGGEVLLQNVTVTGNTGEIVGSVRIDDAQTTLDHVTITGEPGYGLVLQTDHTTLHETVIVGNALGGCLGELESALTVTTAVLDTGFETADCEVMGSPINNDSVGFEALDLTSAYLPTLAPLTGGVLDGASACLDADGAALTEDARGLGRPTASCTVGAHQLEPCGDGILDSGETCDDENTADGDGCSTTCQVETGWSCSGDPSVCNEDGTTLADQVTLMRQATVTTYADWHGSAIDPVSEADMVDLLQPALDELIASGCVIDATTAGWLGGAYDRDEIRGQDDGGATTSISKIGGTFELALSDGTVTTGTYNASRQFYGDRDDGGFIAGKWKRVRGKKGIFYGLSGACAGGQDPRASLNPWYVGHLD